MRYLLFILALLFSLTLFSQGIPIRMETEIDQVISQYGLTGQGVTVVLIDRGVDYRHTDFIDESDNTRIAYIYDMIDPSGAGDADNPYGIGTIFDQTEIQAALDNNTDPPITMDYYGHGTATTGISCGDGSGTTDGAFQGVAPNATIIVIKLTHDFFPATGNLPQQNGFFNPTYIQTALDFAHDKIEELDQPSVTLMNIGSTGGSTDGTSDVCEAIDAFVAQGHPFVCGVGDDGGGENHASTIIPEGGTIELDINKAAGFLRFELWYSEADRYTITIEKPDGSLLGPLVPPLNSGGSITYNFTGITFFHQGADVDFSGASSDRRQILIDLTGESGTYTLHIEGTSVSSTQAFHATLNPASFFTENAFTSYVVPGTSIADYASSFTGITPTNYVAQNNWIDINGIPRDLSSQGNTGELWVGSSEGPTQDGRQGVDLAVPGEVSHAAYSPGTYYGQFDHNILENSNELYGIQNAVSGCAPVLTGIIALMLEADPTLSPEVLSNILQNACIQDEHTGEVPNPTWGYGKLNALQAVDDVLNLVGLPEIQVENNLSVFPNPCDDVIQLVLDDPTMCISTLELIDARGTSVLLDRSGFQGSFEVDLSSQASGMYMLRLYTEDRIINRQILIE